MASHIGASKSKKKMDVRMQKPEGPLVPLAGLWQGMVDWLGKVRLGLPYLHFKYCRNVKIFSQGLLKYTTQFPKFNEAKRIFQTLRELESI